MSESPPASLTSTVSSSPSRVSHSRAQVKIILQAVEAPAHGFMQRSEPRFGLVDPKEPRMDATLMHHAVEIVLQSKKIEGVPVEIVNIIVVYARPFKLEAYCAANLAVLAVDDDPLIFDVTEQAIFRGQVIGVFIEGSKKLLMNLVDVGSCCVFQRRIWSLWGQPITYHAAVSSDGTEPGMLKRGSYLMIGRFC